MLGNTITPQSKGEIKIKSNKLNTVSGIIKEEKASVRSIIESIIETNITMKQNLLKIDIDSPGINYIIQALLTQAKDTGIFTQITFTKGEEKLGKVSINPEKINDEEYNDLILRDIDRLKHGSIGEFPKNPNKKLSAYDKQKEYENYHNFILENLKQKYNIGECSLKIKNTNKFYKEIYEIGDDKISTIIFGFMLLTQEVGRKIGDMRDINKKDFFYDILNEVTKNTNELDREKLSLIFSIIKRNWKFSSFFGDLLEI